MSQERDSTDSLLPKLIKKIPAFDQVDSSNLVIGHGQKIQEKIHLNKKIKKDIQPQYSKFYKNF